MHHALYSWYHQAKTQLQGLLYRWRSWWLQPLIDPLQHDLALRQAQAVQDLKATLYTTIQEDAHAKWVNLNQILLATYQAPQKSLDLRYQSPQSIPQAIELLSLLAPIFDGYLKRSQAYHLLPLLLYHYQELWPHLCRCVVTPSGLTLEHVAWQDLGMHGLLEAIACFTQGIVNEDIPNHYLTHVGGLDERALLALFCDLHKGDYTLDADQPWPSLLGLSLQYSALQYYQDERFAQEKTALKESILSALATLMEDPDGHTTGD